jgi:hypothetical protein
MKLNSDIKVFLIGCLVGLLIFLFTKCEDETKTVTKTVTRVIPTIEKITEVKIDTIYTPVYVEKIKTVKGDTVVIHKDKPSESGNTIEAKQYQTELTSNNATASLTITANELYDVKGTITYPEKETITETTITRDASGFYIYGQMPVSSQLTTPELGVMWQIKNKVIIGGGFNYDNFTNNVNGVITLAVKL